MANFEFTLIFSLPDAEADPAAYIEALGAGGCDDALIGIGLNGRIALNFNREAEDAAAAISSAIVQVRAVIPGAVLAEASPDFVGLTDIADLLGFSRQNMRKIMEQGGYAFPAPLHQGKTAIWHLASVLRWLKERKRCAVDAGLLELAQTTMQCNLYRAARDMDTGLQRNIAGWLR
ncbi:helix-turn-helix transcriptional regulator [Enterobacillus tribolii]|uniref:AlpA family transcriptional regulator n=1 Tax=Enterobacillus tribolii TaxID=1487935 RepID=A0A370QHG6_9GAMM|nr:DNA-binding protein [Enterobacillus tribolii]MBW7982524.1 DNA-binding protein [Enterobacillus tribolii]RDK87803.1 AlpA family transcriptional regulator [Enterobacillus tribolii]